MRVIALILSVGLALLSASSALADRGEPVGLTVIGGDTAFSVDLSSKQAWWLKETCRVTLAIDRSASSDTVLMSEPKTEQVSLGQTQIRLKQQFRFDLSGETANVSVYSSVRGGWAAVPVERDRACQSGTCRFETELPEC